MAPVLARESRELSSMTNREYVAAVAGTLGPLVEETAGRAPLMRV